MWFVAWEVRFLSNYASLTHFTSSPDLAPVDPCLVFLRSPHFLLSCGDGEAFARHVLVNTKMPSTTQFLVICVWTL